MINEDSYFAEKNDRKHFLAFPMFSATLENKLVEKIVQVNKKSSLNL